MVSIESFDTHFGQRRNYWVARAPWWRDKTGESMLVVKLWHNDKRNLRMVMRVITPEGYSGIPRMGVYDGETILHNRVAAALIKLQKSNDYKDDASGEQMKSVEKAVTVLLMTLRMGDE